MGNVLYAREGNNRSHTFTAISGVPSVWRLLRRLGTGLPQGALDDERDPVGQAAPVGFRQLPRLV